ncbi:chaperonin HslO [Bacteriovorax sp. BAL6_X]|uniref:Hsp33 family molecular chaperone HslO n=1 Tax=Bacteriovorax sp. BAL6_X TaxID=1201290 RepID=UPI0003861713|nr:Hsp33 family molecular chaperone HslO [Bacteriovorax sp. BAL6_X]EPZ49702.1 chaperonin HslO [Bacteriovorax sp. BAL6_X]
MIKESRLFNFINKEKTFAISFLEGQKVIHDLALIHSVNNQGFGFFRDCTLSILPIINFLKPQENMGIFIDSENPYFRFKLEMNQAGFFRTLILPEDLPAVPEKISGKLRTAKQFPYSKTPYTSIINVDNRSIKELMNDFFDKSYQMKSQVIISDDSDQVILLTKLPEVNVDKEEIVESVSLKDYIKQNKENFDNIFKQALNEDNEIQKAFEELDFDFLKSTEIKFKCNCSRDRMVTGVAGVVRSSGFADVFHNDASIETKCDYCKTAYLITKDEVNSILNLH